MKWFCPYCWHEVTEKDLKCPNCGADLESFHSMDFDDKLILGLKNPITQTRMFVIELIGRRRVEKAVEHLCQLARDSEDTYELVTIFNALHAIGAQGALECMKELADRKNNHILKKHIEQLLG
ncbi:MAG: HEAT repeat domain-containing protein [Aquificaceae bacterium]|uniref:HEAT repeat domain-containing protein n=1 Tax=Hydrogenobacter sp. Uz 6-8 TaxID=3384828 RepID=UPI0030A59094